MKNILVVDDHPVVREGLRHIVHNGGNGYQVDEAGDGRTLFEKLKRKHYDLVILDIAMPGKDGFELLRDLRTEYPGLPVVLFSNYPESLYGMRAIKSGARGYISKRCSPLALMAALEKVFAGKTYLTPELADSLAEDMSRISEADPHMRLTDREFNIMSRIGRGQRLSAIAEELCISVKTVSTHRANILRKAGFGSNADITRYLTERRMP